LFVTKCCFLIRIVKRKELVSLITNLHFWPSDSFGFCVFDPKGFEALDVTVSCDVHYEGIDS
jgi:hypothetical protein